MSQEDHTEWEAPNAACNDLEGAGKTLCPSCDGRGVIFDVSVNTYHRTCSLCNGTGSVFLDVNKSCTLKEIVDE
jgi:DnaJ-class molecular chaperone